MTTLRGLPDDQCDYGGFVTFLAFNYANYHGAAGSRTGATTYPIGGSYIPGKGTTNYPNVGTPAIAWFDLKNGATKPAGYNHGASSNHGTVVNHAFGDGSCRSIPRSVDMALYMFMVTRGQHDPADDYLTQ